MTDMDDEVLKIADEVRSLSAKHRATHRSIAAVLGLSRQTVGSRLSGKTAFTGAELLILAGDFGEPIAAFFPVAVPA